jgi:hypothetical protein
MNRWPFLIALCVFGLLSRASCVAAPTGAVDLGQNLTYLRIRRLPDDLPALKTAWSKAALILDLRRTLGDGGKDLADVLPTRPAPAPLFVLVGPDTPADVFAALRTRAPALITLGLPAPGLKPDIAPAVKPEDDRRAYDALDAGTSIESLINEKPLGKRFDEAALVHERARDAIDADAARADVNGPPDRGAQVAAPVGDAGVHAAPAAQQAEPKDIVLQRAVQLHRAFLALGKLPRS